MNFLAAPAFRLSLALVPLTCSAAHAVENATSYAMKPGVAALNPPESCSTS